MDPFSARIGRVHETGALEKTVTHSHDQVPSSDRLRSFVLLCGCTPLWSLVVPEQRHSRYSRSLASARRRPPADPAAGNRLQPRPRRRRDRGKCRSTRPSASRWRTPRSSASWPGTAAVSSGQTIYDPAISNTAIDEARSVFDPALSVNNTFNRTEKPEAFLDPAESHRDEHLRHARRQLHARPGRVEAQRHRRQHQAGIYRQCFAAFIPVSFRSIRQDRDRPVLELYPAAARRARASPPTSHRSSLPASTPSAPISSSRTACKSLVRGVIEAYWNVVFARTDVWARRSRSSRARSPTSSPRRGPASASRTPPRKPRHASRSPISRRTWWPPRRTCSTAKPPCATSSDCRRPNRSASS